MRGYRSNARRNASCFARISFATSDDFSDSVLGVRNEEKIKRATCFHEPIAARNMSDYLVKMEVYEFSRVR